MQPLFTPTFDTLVTAALERLGAESMRSAHAARTDDDQTFFQASADAYAEALAAWGARTYPQRTESGAWLVPDEEPHLLILDGDWICSCGAASPHWPIALMVAIEVAYDSLGDTDDGEITVEDPEPSAPATQAHEWKEAA